MPHRLGVVSQRYEAYTHLLALPDSVTLECATADANHPDIAACNLLLADPDLGAQALAHTPNLQWLQSTWAGVTPLLKASRRDYLLTGVKGVFSAQIREYVLTYMLHFERQVSPLRQQQAQRQWHPRSVTTLSGKTLGLLGVGNIGLAVAEAAHALGMTVIGVNRNGRTISPLSQAFSLSDCQQLALNADYVVNLLPDTNATTGLINPAFLTALGPSGVFINAGRGSAVDEPALVSALSSGQLKGAVLDVFQSEPLPESHPFWTTPNLIITPHIAGVSHPEDIAALFQRNVERWLSEQPLQYVVDWQKGY